MTAPAPSPAPLLRSLLFAPGSNPQRLEKLGTTGADAIVLDLEDAVAEAEKDQARLTVRAALPGYTQDQLVVVRVNSLDSGRLEADLAAVVCAELDAVVVPKVDGARMLAEADAAIGAAERSAGLATGAIRLIALIESASGLAAAHEICAAAPARLLTVCLGSVDLARDVGYELTPDASELLYARSRIVLAARAAGLPAPIDGPWLWLEDGDGLATDTRRSRQLGFQGRVVVHPAQVGPAQEIYAGLDDEDIRHAETVVREFESALAQGVAAARIDGQFVDAPVYEQAKERLRRSARGSTSG